ncbi:MAG: hypothetical protein PW789_09380 [Edaphobacter sp.]|uniref:hypothetical protein n=1 Tax=Edaphobacter sp. TaxID=1934404 RepID=UPI0023A073FB|nr:hypothetical protein [Edaphobacter sp.]MDE1176806.1 hypothetical protein [Edaphobacter sp.]
MRSHLCRIVLIVLTLACGVAAAQPTDADAEGLPLNGVLLRLQIRRWEYARNIPDFFADERIVSEMHGKRVADVQTVTESLFRLRRGDRDTYPPDLFETRTVKRRDGVDMPPGTAFQGPSVIIGAFSNGLRTITLEQEACYNFHISHHRDVHHEPAITITYRMKPGAERKVRCLPWGDVRGEAVVNLNNFDVLHFEMKVPHYNMVPGVVGPWRWSIDYEPVSFDGRSFYLPQRIESESASEDGKMEWNFTATYRNYHKTGVHSRIIPDLNDGLTPP